MDWDDFVLKLLELFKRGIGRASADERHVGLLRGFEGVQSAEVLTTLLLSQLWLIQLFWIWLLKVLLYAKTIFSKFACLVLGVFVRILFYGVLVRVFGTVGSTFLIQRLESLGLKSLVGQVGFWEQFLGDQRLLRCVFLGFKQAAGNEVRVDPEVLVLVVVGDLQEKLVLHQVVEGGSVLRVVHQTNLNEVLGQFVLDVGKDDLLVASLDELAELVEHVWSFLEGEDF